jgi:adenylate cyclase
VSEPDADGTRSPSDGAGFRVLRPEAGGSPGDPAEEGRRAAALAHVRSLLHETGASDEEIDRAVAEGVLDLFVVDRILVPAPRRYTQSDVARLTGLDVDLLHRFWRALGFLDVDDQERAFTDLDIEAVRLFQALLALGAAEVETAVQLARVIGSSMARIAEAELAPGALSLGDETDPVLAADAFASVADATIPAMARLLEFVWRRHVQAATQRTMVVRSHAKSSGTSPVMAVGFADMVGFTLLSQHLAEDELAAVVSRFEEISHDIVTGRGGRVVKMIGDEVMFVVDSVTAGALIGLDLAEAYADDELLSDVRVGLAVGPVLVRDGDYFGRTVNLAHRIVNIANPGTVLLADDFHSRLLEEAPDQFSAQALRPRYLKDFGRVQLWWCGRPGQDVGGTGAAADRRRNVRWERLSEIIRDLEDLREVGERLLTSGRRATAPARAGAPGDPGGGDAAPGSESGQPEGGQAEGP